MPFSTDDFDQWKQGVDPSEQKAVDTGADMSGMPTFARLRLKEHVAGGRRRVPFTSNLSVNESLLSRSIGFEPVAQVLGTSVYHVGWQNVGGANAWYFMAYATPYELQTQVQARMDCWSQARYRLEQQAHVAGAHTVVGVRVDHGGFDDKLGRLSGDATNADVVEFSLAGTAVRLKGEIATDRPLLSSLSGQDLLALRAVGYIPSGIVYGCSVYYQPSMSSFMTGMASNVLPGTQWTNQEVSDYTQGFIEARRLAEQRMFDQAMIYQSSGVLDVHVATGAHEVEREINDQKQLGLVVTVEVYGTAIAQTDEVVNTAVWPYVSLQD
jgi:uncharacterized protein YbjQ (UPF0145 family)